MADDEQTSSPLYGHQPSFMDKVKKSPFVPLGLLIFWIIRCSSVDAVVLGALTTAGVLVYGLAAFGRGDTRKSQLAMRARVAAQFFTIVVAGGGMILASNTSLFGGNDKK